MGGDVRQPGAQDGEGHAAVPQGGRGRHEGTYCAGSAGCVVEGEGGLAIARMDLISSTTRNGATGAAGVGCVRVDD
eukprot:COSAG02_NODE_427_length_22498_cov_11.745212_5_plen_76_part_00